MLDQEYSRDDSSISESKTRRKIESSRNRGISHVSWRSIGGSQLEGYLVNLSSSLQDRRSSAPPLASFLPSHTARLAADTRCEQQAPLSTVFSTPVSLPTTPQLFDAAASRSTSRVHALEEEFYLVVGLARLEVEVVLSLSSKKKGGKFLFVEFNG